jgi:hypothetical protein
LDSIDGSDIQPNNLNYTKKATWLTQFSLLSGRTFKNLYRNPSLLLTHYAISMVLAGWPHSLPFASDHFFLPTIIFRFLWLLILRRDKQHCWVPESNGTVLFRVCVVWIWLFEFHSGTPLLQLIPAKLTWCWDPQVFSAERVLFMKERANGYYRPSAYFLAKV